MIGWLHGSIVSKTPPGLILNVNGIGYEVETSMNTFCLLPEVGEVVSLYAHFWVREDAQRLFGFADMKERTLFRRLIKVSGIGAKVALAILSSMSPESFVACVLSQEVNVLIRVPGIGKKTAERLLVEVKDNVSEWGSEALAASSTEGMLPHATHEAVEGLIALGYKPQDAAKMVKKVNTEGLTSASLIRAALQEVTA